MNTNFPKKAGIYKLTQRHLLEKSFWDKFPVVKQGWELAKQTASVVAPEIHDPLKRGFEKYREMGKNIKRAGMTREQIVVEAIIEDGFIPIGYPNDYKINWASKKNTDGTFTGTVHVGEMEYDKNGEPTVGRTYKDTRKSNLIFRYNPDDKSVRIVKNPHRHLASEDSDIEDITNAMTKAGYISLTPIKIISKNKNGLIIASTKIRDPQSGKKIKFDFSYDSPSEQIQPI